MLKNIFLRDWKTKNNIFSLTETVYMTPTSTSNYYKILGNWLYVSIMSNKRYSESAINLGVVWTSMNSLLETGAISED